MKFDTGEVAWRDRSVGKGSLVYADGNLYCLSESGVVGLVEATPIVRANRVFISSDYGTGGGVVEIKPDNKAQEIWFTKDMRNHHSSSVLIGDYLYGFSSAILTAIKFDTGEIAWRDRSVGKGSLVYADGNLYCFSENGVVGLVEATPTGYKEKGRFRIPQDSLPTWTHPVVAGGRLYLRDQDTIYAFDVREKK
jgi:hypothetical protein